MNTLNFLNRLMCRIRFHSAPKYSSPQTCAAVLHPGNALLYYARLTQHHGAILNGKPTRRRHPARRAANTDTF